MNENVVVTGNLNLSLPTGDKYIAFISGPISGDKNYKQRFSAVQKKLEDKGYVVINQCGTVVFLDRWRHSEGAKLEMVHSIKKDKIIILKRR
jgi:hypothetical protein